MLWQSERQRHTLRPPHCHTLTPTGYLTALFHTRYPSDIEHDTISYVGSHPQFLPPVLIHPFALWFVCCLSCAAIRSLAIFAIRFLLLSIASLLKTSLSPFL